MRKTLLFAVVAVAPIMLASAVQARDLKIGVVDMQRAMSETKEGRAAEETLENYKKSKEAELNRKLKEMYDKDAELRKAASVLKEDERRKRMGELNERVQALQKQYLDAERELMNKKTKAMMQISQKITRVIEKIAKRDSFDYIFANAAVLWAPRHVDLTNEVIRMYDETAKK